MTGQEQAHSEKESAARRMPVVNFRPFLFCALGLAFGVFLYTRIRFGGLVPSDFLFLAAFLPLTLFPITKRRILLALCLFLVFAGAGTLGIHLYTETYLSGAESGTYLVEGTVERINVQNGYTGVELSDLLFDGESGAGKMAATVSSESLRPGDRIRFSANVMRIPLPAGTEDSYDFVNDIRYFSYVTSFEDLPDGFHPFLFVNRTIYDTLQEEMGGEEANISYALLTGNSRMMDSDFANSVRMGGIAHIFAVSGLHIGILYGFVSLLFRPLKRYSFLPAATFALLYCALCGFSVSSLRALIMCICLGVNIFLGRKPDLLSSLSFAGTLILLFLPAQWLSVGFRLSFGACLGLALFSGSLARGMKKLHIPDFLTGLVSSSFSVQLFTFPILLEAFGYFSVWGILLNLILVPLLPVAFVALLLCMLLSLIIPPAAAFFLIFPKGIFALLLLLFASDAFTFVLTGFSLGAGGVVWLCGCVGLSERVRFSPLARGILAGVLALLFALGVTAQNAIFGGCTVESVGGSEGIVTLIRTPEEHILIVGGTASLSDCSSFLSRRTNRVDAAVVLSQDIGQGVNIAAFTGAQTVYVRENGEFGLHVVSVESGEMFWIGEVGFRYETDSLLTVFVRESVLTLDIRGFFSPAADLSVQKECGTLKYYFDYGIILKL